MPTYQRKIMTGSEQWEKVEQSGYTPWNSYRAVRLSGPWWRHRYEMHLCGIRRWVPTGIYRYTESGVHRAARRMGFRSHDTP